MASLTDFLASLRYPPAQHLGPSPAIGCRAAAPTWGCPAKASRTINSAIPPFSQPGVFLPVPTGVLGMRWMFSTPDSVGLERDKACRESPGELRDVQLLAHCQPMSFGSCNQPYTVKMSLRASAGYEAIQSHRQAILSSQPQWIASSARGLLAMTVGILDTY